MDRLQSRTERLPWTTSRSSGQDCRFAMKAVVYRCSAEAPLTIELDDDQQSDAAPSRRAIAVVGAGLRALSRVPQGSSVASGSGTIRRAAPSRPKRSFKDPGAVDAERRHQDP